jgi:hypothetical protein
VSRSSSPTPNLEDVLDFIAATHPTAAPSLVRESWNTIKGYFSGDDTDLASIQSLVNVDSLIAAFSTAPQILDVSTASLPGKSASSSRL